MNPENKLGEVYYSNNGERATIIGCKSGNFLDYSQHNQRSR